MTADLKVGLSDPATRGGGLNDPATRGGGLYDPAGD
jgi:hypothetical protein